MSGEVRNLDEEYPGAAPAKRLRRWEKQKSEEAGIEDHAEDAFEQEHCPWGTNC